MRKRRPSLGLLSIIAAATVVGLVVATAASPVSEATRKRTTVRVPMPARGDATLAIVRFRGRLVGRPVLRNLRRLPTTAVALAAKRQLRGGRTEVWLAVLNRGPGARRSLSSTTAGSQDRTPPKAFFDLDVTERQERERRDAAYSFYPNVSTWRNAPPPPICSPPPRPTMVRIWRVEERAAALDLFALILLGLCDRPISPELAAQWGIPHPDVSVDVPAPTQFVFGGTIRAPSFGYRFSGLPAVLSLSGSDAPNCRVGSERGENVVRCTTRKPAGGRVDVRVTTRERIDTMRAALIRAGVQVTPRREVGPFRISRGPHLTVDGEWNHLTFEDESYVCALIQTHPGTRLFVEVTGPGNYREVFTGTAREGGTTRVRFRIFQAGRFRIRAVARNEHTGDENTAQTFVNTNDPREQNLSCGR